MTVATARNLVHELRQAIIQGSYRPGERLRLEELAARFGVSTMPVREALKTLETEGIVTTQAHRGAQVTRFTSTQILELYEVRALLEQFATVKAVPNLTGKDVQQLRSLISTMDEAADRADYLQFNQLNIKFHNLLYERCGRPYLIAQIRDRRFQVQHYLHRNLEHVHNNLNNEHKIIMGAVETGHAELAGVAIHQHILSAGQSISSLLGSEGIVEDQN